MPIPTRVGCNSRGHRSADLLDLEHLDTPGWDLQNAVSRYHDGGGEALVFAVAPAEVLAFGKGTFSHTRHRF
jgi:hypothetical protein